MNQQDVNKIIRKIDDLPTLPRTVLRITELVNNPKSSARDLARVITDDQVLTARLLRLVNSSFYGFPNRISTVTGAVVLLGFEAIRNLLLTTSVFDLFSDGKKKGETQLEKLWDHSLGCAVGAKVIGARRRHEKVEELFVAGLLHDIGKIVELTFMPDVFQEITRLAENENLLISEAEMQVLGYTHCHVGEVLAQRWNLPPKLTRTISGHHNLRQVKRFSIETAIVHLADILCRALSIGFGGDKRIPDLDPMAVELLRLEKQEISPILWEMEKTLADIDFNLF